MSAGNHINWRPTINDLRERATEVLDGAIGFGVDEAQRRAPVRRTTRKRRPRTKAFVHTRASLAFFAKHHLAGGRQIIVRRHAQPSSEINTRGAYEIRRAKAHKSPSIHTARGSYAASGEVGGFLRDHIEPVNSALDGLVLRGRIASRARYSRYVEFPTSRTAAQPFLLPAWRMAGKMLKRNLAKEFR